MSEYQYPDNNDKLFADMMANESRLSRKVPKITLPIRKSTAQASSSNTGGAIRPVRKPKFKAKLHPFGKFKPKAAGLNLSTYWEASETLALKRCLPLIFSSENINVKSADIGCGQGRLINLLAMYSSVVVGLEPSQERFEIAAKSADSLPNAVVINGTADTLPSESFDVVFCSHVIQHLCFAEQEKLAANILRVLKPGGIALVTTTFTSKEQSEYIIEYWKNGKRAHDIIDAATFEEAYGRDDILPVRHFSYKDLLSYFDGCELMDFRCFHFSGVRNARLDALFNRLGDLSRAKDAYYVLKKVEHD